MRHSKGTKSHVLAVKKHRQVKKFKKDLTGAEESKLYYLDTAEHNEGEMIQDVENERISEKLPDVDPALLAGCGI